LMAQADGSSLQVSALPYTDEVMTPIEYTVDLPKSTNTVLTLAARTLGAGSAGCGPRPLDQYIVWSEPAAFSYCLRLLPAGEKDLAAAGRMAVPQNRVRSVVGSRDISGRVSLACATEGARIEYALDGTSWRPYTEPFECPAGTLSLRATSGGLLPYQSAIVFEERPLRGKWKVVEVSSYESGEGDPANVLDGDPDTFWHSHWSGEAAQPPHFLVIDLAKELNVGAVVYTARRGIPNGNIKDYEIYVSNDPKTWGAPAAKGSFRRNAQEQTIRLSQPVKGRYLKLVALSEQRGQPFAAVAELDVIEAKAP